MQPNTPAAGSYVIPGIHVPEPTPGGPRVLQPLQPKVQQSTHLGTHGDQRVLSTRHIANLTTPSIDSGAPPIEGEVLCVIAGYTLTKQNIWGVDRVPLNGLMASHVTLVMYLRERLGQLITQTELKNVIQVRAETTVGSYLNHVPKAFGIERGKNEQGVKCWVMGAPKRLPPESFREVAPQAGGHGDGAKRKQQDDEDGPAKKRAKIDIGHEGLGTAHLGFATDDIDFADVPRSQWLGGPLPLPETQSVDEQTGMAQDGFGEFTTDDFLHPDYR
ncbi:hypothetical protein [Hydrogenophaga sp.]|uniref:hypothetical protein n=1 Tax=Hydrogenophaga sp. TaxID=1904254 RepID=UPI00271F0921|nr:hypothetical protein [Hydrogenophaga sp.]MDO9437798.1 hypothetical protein [Hydrogenophaga sp.]